MAFYYSRDYSSCEEKYLKKINKSVQINLQGGIGNQLFIYYAGLYWAQVNNADLIINTGVIGIEGVHHGAELDELHLVNKMVKIRPSSLELLTSKVFRKLSKNFFTARLLSAVRRKSYYSTVIGYDHDLLKHKHLRKIEGYFQTYRYFDGIQTPKLQTLRMKLQSDWFSELNEELEATPFIAIHVRRGDFKNFATEVGLLSEPYYRRGIQEIDSKIGQALPIYVFSDEIEVAKELLVHLRSRVLRWVDQPSGTSPIESLLLMSQSSAIVIANSTFSWWAAKLGKSKHVVAPAQWFRKGTAPKDLYPPDWQLIPSVWES